MANVIFYTSHCPQCMAIKMMLDAKHVPYAEVDSEEEYMKVARENGISSMPFAVIDGEVYNTKNLREYIKGVKSVG